MIDEGQIGADTFHQNDKLKSFWVIQFCLHQALDF